MPLYVGYPIGEALLLLFNSVSISGYNRPHDDLAQLIPRLVYDQIYTGLLL